MKKSNIQKQISTLFINKLYELTHINETLKVKLYNSGSIEKQKINDAIRVNIFAIKEINNLYDAVSRAFYLDSLMKDN